MFTILHIFLVAFFHLPFTKAELELSEQQKLSFKSENVCFSFEDCLWTNEKLPKSSRSLPWLKTNQNFLMEVIQHRRIHYNQKNIPTNQSLEQTEFIVSGTEKPDINPKEKLSAFLVSGIIPCQNGSAQLTFRYWTSPLVLIKVCALRYTFESEKTNFSNEFDFCWLVNSDQGPGPANIVLSFQNGVPFQIFIISFNFVHPQGGYAIISNLSYHGQICENSNFSLSEKKSLKNSKMFNVPYDETFYEKFIPSTPFYNLKKSPIGDSKTLLQSASKKSMSNSFNQDSISLVSTINTNTVNITKNNKITINPINNNLINKKSDEYEVICDSPNSTVKKITVAEPITFTTMQYVIISESTPKQQKTVVTKTNKNIIPILLNKNLTKQINKNETLTLKLNNTNNDQTILVLLNKTINDDNIKPANSIIMTTTTIFKPNIKNDLEKSVRNEMLKSQTFDTIAANVTEYSPLNTNFSNLNFTKTNSNEKLLTTNENLNKIEEIKKFKESTAAHDKAKSTNDFNFSSTVDSLLINKQSETLQQINDSINNENNLDKFKSGDNFNNINENNTIKINLKDNEVLTKPTTEQQQIKQSEEKQQQIKQPKEKQQKIEQPEEKRQQIKQPEEKQQQTDEEKKQQQLIKQEHYKQQETEQPKKKQQNEQKQIELPEEKQKNEQQQINEKKKIQQLIEQPEEKKQNEQHQTDEEKKKQQLIEQEHHKQVQHEQQQKTEEKEKQQQIEQEKQHQHKQQHINRENKQQETTTNKVDEEQKINKKNINLQFDYLNNKISLKLNDTVRKIINNNYSNKMNITKNSFTDNNLTTTTTQETIKENSVNLKQINLNEINAETTTPNELITKNQIITTTESKIMEKTESNFNIKQNDLLLNDINETTVTSTQIPRIIVDPTTIDKTSIRAKPIQLHDETNKKSIKMKDSEPQKLFPKLMEYLNSSKFLVNSNSNASYLNSTSILLPTNAKLRIAVINSMYVLTDSKTELPDASKIVGNIAAHFSETKKINNFTDLNENLLKL